MIQMSFAFHDGLTIEKFWLSWFGLFGRELGSDAVHPFGVNPKDEEKSHRQYCDNPTEFLDFVSWCKSNQHACWITSQPMRHYGMPLGIEKIFFDFDYHLEKNEDMTPEKKAKVAKEFLELIESLDYEPLIVSTRKGFHAYVFLRRVYEFDPINVEFAKEVFGVLGLSLLGIPKLYCQLKEEERAKWKYLDFAVLADIMRMARVPLTLHEGTGLPCRILDKDLKPTKIRSLDLYKAYGLREDKVQEAVDIVKEYHKRKTIEEMHRVQNAAKDFSPENGKFQGRIRPCFVERLRLGVMCHQQRLALLPEAYWSFSKEDRENFSIAEEKLMETCHQFKDFKEYKSRTQVLWFLKRPKKFPPYHCSTIKSYGWCLKSECKLYKNQP